jgi:hypothetical protein
MRGEGVFMATMTTPIINITLNADIFVIPNSASKADLEWSMGRDLAAYYQKVAELNDLEYIPEVDPFLQLWLVGTGEENGSVKSENLARHGFTVAYDGWKYHFNEGDLEMIPWHWFEGKKEGETLTLTFPLRPSWATDSSGIDLRLRNRNHKFFQDDETGEWMAETPLFHITFNLRLNQAEYRYRNFGTFDEVMMRVYR